MRYHTTLVRMAIIKILQTIFHRTITNNFTICMEIQKTSNSQSNFEKEEWNWRYQPAGFRLYYKATVMIKQCDTGPKTDIWTNETEQRSQK